MTPFCAAAVKVLRASHNGTRSAYDLRKALLHKGWGKHPAAVAMNLTRLARNGEYITSFISNDNCRTFVLTVSGECADLDPEAKN